MMTRRDKTKNSQFKKHTIEICHWNIQGMSSKVHGRKCENETFLDIVKGYDIIGLSETHTNQDTNIVVDGYTSFSVCRGKHLLAKKESGGMVLLLKNHIMTYANIIKSKSTDIIWVKLSKKFIDAPKDLYIGFVYISPRNSSYATNNDYQTWEILYQEINRYQSSGNIMLMGDFNARTGLNADFIENDSTNPNDLPNLPDFYQPDKPIQNRLSQDGSRICEYGKNLIDLCISAGLRILNGRTLGDSIGKYTCHKYNGSSVIDYAIVENELIDKILYFQVLEHLSELSDHCPIATKMYCRVLDNNIKVKKQRNVESCPYRIKWDDITLKIFTKNINSSRCIAELENFMKEELNEMNINSHIEKVGKWLFNQTGKYKHNKNKKKIIHKKRKEWFNQNCKSLQLQLRGLGNQLTKQPHNVRLREQFFVTKKKYKKCCKISKRQFRQNLLNLLENMEQKNPKKYWDILEKLKNLDSDNVNSKNPICEEDWVQYYKDLFKQKSIPQEINEKAKKEIDDLISEPFFNELDYIITDAEIAAGINKLKLGKAVGLDCISGEILKICSQRMIPWLKKIFNSILQLGKYPNTWSEGIINTLHKSGNVQDPNNYRGITITSCLGKLFSIILNKRLECFVAENSILKPNQIGFQNKCRTSDHMFIIRTLIDKYTNNKSKRNLFCCFVDFRKAFDCVWHNGLFLKLLRYNIRGHFFNLIRDMYKKVTARINMYTHLSEKIECKVGVKQGDVLSPNLFNIYINDIPDALTNDQDSPILDDIPINCLMYADDLVLISLTASGLQKQLNELDEYCKKWFLSVNISKTKVMQISKTKITDNIPFKFDGKVLEYTDKYKYLGIQISSDGAMKSAQINIKHRALKAIYKLRSTLLNCDINPRLCLKLFDQIIKPVTLYGSEIWANVPFSRKPYNHNTIWQYVDSLPIESLHIKFCKYTLGVNVKATNIAVMGELGRYPLGIDILVQMFKFHEHVQTHTNVLVLAAFKESNKIHDKGGLSWMTFFKGVSENPDICSSSNNHIDKWQMYKQCLVSSFIQKWDSSLCSNSAKLIFYKSFKSTFVYENYLNLVKSRKERVALTKIRISAHRLAIEKGRYAKPRPIPREERWCLFCKLLNHNHIGDELHMFTQCPKFDTERQLLYQKVLNICPTFSLMDDNAKVNYLMIAEGDIPNLVAKFCLAVEI